jgi:hypothetical protein
MACISSVPDNLVLAVFAPEVEAAPPPDCKQYEPAVDSRAVEAPPYDPSWICTGSA